MINYAEKYCLVSLLLVNFSITVFASTSDDWFSAASTGNTSAIQKLFDEKANINDNGSLNMTPLMVASLFGKTDVVQQLLDAHAGINLQSGSGLTALMFASQKGHVDVVKLLVDAGANKKLKSTSGTSALKYAIEKGYEDIIALLKTPLENKYVQPASEAVSFVATAAKNSKKAHIAAGIMANTVTDIDGNVYHTVKIGTQTWTVENLKTTKFNDGTSIPLVTDSAIWANNSTPAYCWYNNDTTANKNTFGALYNWYTVNIGKLAPACWHVPTDAEWGTLLNYLIANGYNYDRTTTGNYIAKALAAQTNWTSFSTVGTIGCILSTNNRSGFSALPGGYRNDSGCFCHIDYYGYWWSVTEYNVSYAYCRYLGYGNYYLFRNYYYKSCGFSVRLVRD